MSHQKNKPTNINEPSAIYGMGQLAVFNSFEEEAEYVARQRAETSYEKRLTDMEQLRKRVFDTHLLPDNTWKPIARTFKIMLPHTDEDSQ